MKILKLLPLLVFVVALRAQRITPPSGGSGSGSGTVSPGTVTQLAVYTGSTTIGSVANTVVNLGLNLIDLSGLTTLKAPTPSPGDASSSVATTNFFTGCTFTAGAFACPSSLSSGVGSSAAGAIDMVQGTGPGTFPANAWSIYANASIATSFQWVGPSVAATGFVLGTATGNTVALTQVGFTGTGNVVRATAPTIDLSLGTGLPAGGLASISADNIFGNFTAGTAVPGTQAVPACAGDGAHALTYVSHVLTCTPVSGGATPVTSVNTATGAVVLFAPNAQTGTYQVLAADFVGCKTITIASGTFTVTLVASGSQPASGQCIKVVNYGSGVVTIARSGQNINGGTASLTLNAASATAPSDSYVVSDGTNYFASVNNPGTGGGGGGFGPVGVSRVSTAQTTTSLCGTAFVDLTTPDSVTFTLSATTNIAAQFLYSFSVNQNGAEVQNQFNVDGSLVSATLTKCDQNNANFITACQSTYAASLASGSHTIKVQHCLFASGTETVSNRMLLVTSTP